MGELFMWREEVLLPMGGKLQSWSRVSLAEGYSDAGRIVSITCADRSLLTLHLQENPFSL